MFEPPLTMAAQLTQTKARQKRLNEEGRASTVGKMHMSSGEYGRRWNNGRGCSDQGARVQVRSGAHDTVSGAACHPHGSAQVVRRGPIHADEAGTLLKRHKSVLWV